MATSKRMQLSLSETIPMFLKFCETHFSPNTCAGYTLILDQFLEFHHDAPLNSIQAEDIEKFLHHMKHTPYKISRGVAAIDSRTRPRKPKTLANMHIGLSSFWRWASQRGYVPKDIMNAVPAIKVHQEPVDPLADTELANLIRATARSREYHSKATITNMRLAAERDKAIIGLLSETAIRVSEACSLKMKHLTFEPGSSGGGMLMVELGKGNKSRIVPFSRRCASWLKEYVSLRPAALPEDWLFVGVGRYRGQQLTRSGVLGMIKGLGERIGVHVTPHRLRTTAACMMLQNGMGIYDLQRIMGHSDIKTTKRYVAAARVDLAAAMKKASPLDNIRL